MPARQSQLLGVSGRKRPVPKAAAIAEPHSDERRAVRMRRSRLVLAQLTLFPPPRLPALMVSLDVVKQGAAQRILRLCGPKQAMLHVPVADPHSAFPGGAEGREIGREVDRFFAKAPQRGWAPRLWRFRLNRLPGRPGIRSRRHAPARGSLPARQGRGLAPARHRRWRRWILPDGSCLLAVTL